MMSIFNYFECLISGISIQNLDTGCFHGHEIRKIFIFKKPKTFTNSWINIHCHIPDLPSTNQNWKNQRKWIKNQSNVSLFPEAERPSLEKSHKPIGEITMTGSRFHVKFRRQIYAGYEKDCALQKAVMIQKCSWNKNLMIELGVEGDFSFE